MPRGRPKKVKIEEVKIDNKPVIEMEMTPTEPDKETASAPVIEEVKTSLPSSQSMPVVSGVKVVAILNDGKETETHFHVAFENGTTGHVEKRLFQ